MFKGIRLNRFSVISVIISMFIASIAQAQYSGGDGSEANPYQIATAEDLIALGQNTEDYALNFIMTQNIDLSGYTFDKAVIAPDNAISPFIMPYTGTKFSGNFNGAGKYIRNLSVSGDSYVGLFGYIDGGTVENLNLNNIDIFGYEHAGGVCGHNSGIINKCSVNGIITSWGGSSGGICGSNDDYVSSCFSSIKLLTSFPYQGGVCGYNSGNIQNCYSIGTVKGSSYVGGICGYAYRGQISNNFSLCEIISNGSSKGAILGYRSSSPSVAVSSCFWNTQICGVSSGVGSGSSTGTTGLDTEGMYLKSNFINAGWDLSETDGDAADWQMQDGWYPALAWETPELIPFPDLSGMTLELAQSTLSNAGINLGETYYSYNEHDAGIVYEQSPDNNNVWRVGFPITIDIGVSLGIKLSGDYSGGDGTETNPYQIATADDLISLGNNTDDYSSYFVLTQDIDLSGHSFNLAVVANTGKVFNGHFDGNGHIVSNFTGAIPGSAGLFGTIGSEGTVQDLGLINVDISGNGEVFGAICALNQGLISNCFTSGSVVGYGGMVGGLCGFNRGEINNSYSICTVVGHESEIEGMGLGHEVGGLCGVNTGLIQKCYAAGEVSGNAVVGLLCGNNIKGSAANCYFYQYGGPDNRCGTALSYEQINNRNEFTGFDFAGDASDGSEDVWDIEEGYMPRLSWQSTPGFAVSNFLEDIETVLEGSGTVTDPFVIKDVIDLLEFRSNAELRIGHYRLDADIDLLEVNYLEAFIPEPFLGYFDGNGHAISNFRISGENYSGFFSTLLGGTVSSLGLEDIVVSGTNFIGGICGRNDQGKIEKCFVIGFVWTNVANSYDAGTMCGQNYYGFISNSYAAGGVRGCNNVGGFCGNSSGDITNCYAASYVTYFGSNAGGFIGKYSSGNVSGCFWDVQASNTSSGVGYGSVAGVTGLDTEQMLKIDNYVSGGWDFTEDDGDAVIWNKRSGWYPSLCWEDFDLTVQIPDITGMTSEQANSVLQGSDVKIGTNSKYYSYNKGEVDVIFGQYPTSESVWREGFPIYLKIGISRGDRYSGGTGTQEEPFVIATADDLIYLGSHTEDYSKYFVMTEDIDLSGQTFSKALIAWDTDTDTTFDGRKFNGYFDGGGHVISNLSIDGSYYCGLFGYIDAEGTVVNLGLVKTDNTGLGYIGGLCGYNGGNIRSSYATGYVSGSNYDLGGFCGYNKGSIGQCYSFSFVAGNTSYGHVGGFCGSNATGAINECFAVSDITATGNNIGGFVGYIYSGTISGCFWDEQICNLSNGTGYGSSSGIVGLDTSGMHEIGDFIAAGWNFSDSDGDVADWQMPEGWYPALAWENVEFSVHIPDISEMTLEQAEDILLANGFNIGEVSYYYNHGENVIFEQALSADGPWRFGFPIMVDVSVSRGAKYSGGSGSESEPCRIETVDDLITLANSAKDYGMSFVLSANIDLAGYSFDNALIAPDIDSDSNYNGTMFNGHLDGGGHIISNLVIVGNSNCGLIGAIDYNGVVENIGLENADVTGVDYIGVLCGRNYGLVRKCYSIGNVYATGNTVGGLCGSCNGSIIDCYASGAVHGTDYVGGLCGSCGGYNSTGIINRCYATSIVSGNSTRGLVGNLLYPSTIENSFWDVQASTANLGGKAVGLSTSEMQDMSNFIEAGWDFSEADGDVSDWQMPSGWYPALAWENVILDFQVPDFVGMTQEQVEAVLQNSDINFVAQNYLYNKGEVGEVYGQYPASNSMWRSGFALTIYIDISLGERYSGGNGTIEDPFVLSTLEDLISLGENTEDYSKYFVLGQDIDLGGYVFEDGAVIAAYPNKGFSGSFDGCGYVVRNFALNGQDYCGFFGMINTTGSVKNLGIENVTITASGWRIGGLCGDNSGIISNCYAESHITATNSVAVGGFCGVTQGKSTIRNCYSFGSICEVDVIVEESSIVNNGDSSINAIERICFGRAGGFVGSTGSLCKVTNCYTSCMMSSPSEHIGGFVGANSSGALTGCYWDQQVSGLLTASGSGEVNGITGLNTSGMLTMTSYTKAGWDFTDTDGDASDWKMFGGWYPVLDWEDVVFDDFVPDLTGMTLEQAQVELQNCGMVLGEISYSYSVFDVDLVCKQSPMANSGRRAQLPQKVDVVLSLGLRYTGGNGTEADPFQLAKAEDFVDLGVNTEDYDKNFVLTDDIDMSGYIFDKAVIAFDTDTASGFQGVNFTGNFDGKGYVIRNLKIDSSGDYNGLFGYSSNAVFSNIVLENADVTGGVLCNSCLFGFLYSSQVSNCIVNNSKLTLASDSSDNKYFNYAGLLVGHFQGGTISSCHVSGSIVSNLVWNDGIGGLCGVIYFISGGQISDCSARVDMLISGDNCYSIGGFVGYNGGNIRRCYSEGKMTVTGEVDYSHIGGFAGYNGQEIRYCYANFDITTSGMTKQEGYTDPHKSVGGFCGSNYNRIYSSYALGKVNTDLLKTNSGGFCGVHGGTSGNITNCFWNTETSLLVVGYNISNISPATVTNVLGLTTAEMMTLATYTAAGWDFSDTDGNPADWQMVRPGEDYPRLAWQEPVAGDIAGSWGVDMADLELLAAYWLAEEPAFDIDGTEGVDMLDFAVMAGNWLSGIISTDLEPASHLLGHWALDETEGSVAFDSSEYTNDGTIFGEPAREAGIIDGCYTFNGTSDYIIAGSARGVRGAMSRTISAYIKADEDLANGETGLHDIVTWGEMGTAKLWIFALDGATGKLCLAAYGARLVGGSDLEDGQWHHVAIVLPSGANNINQVKMFVDGTEIQTNAADLDLIINTSATEVVIGGHNSSTDPSQRNIAGHFAGSIDDVQIHNIALSEEEIAEMATEIE